MQHRKYGTDHFIKTFPAPTKLYKKKTVQKSGKFVKDTLNAEQKYESKFVFLLMRHG
jgi:hypothetical protein